MIKINLALKKSASLVAGAGAGADGATMATALTRLTKLDLKSVRLEDFRSIPKLKELLILIVFYFGASYGTEYYYNEEVSKRKVEIDELKQRETGLKKALEEVKKYDSVKSSLESDERVVTTKLDTIEKLKQDRTAPAKTMLALSTAIPRDAWLNDLKVESNDAIVMSGNAIDFVTVSAFVKGMNESVFFKDVKLVSTDQQSNGAQDIIRFEITARRR